MVASIRPSRSYESPGSQCRNRIPATQNKQYEHTACHCAADYGEIGTLELPKLNIEDGWPASDLHDRTVVEVLLVSVGTGEVGTHHKLKDKMQQGNR